MYELSLFPLAAGTVTIATVYWICFIVGGGLLVISSLSGADTDAGIDADVDLDMDVDADFDADSDFDGGHGGALASWFSLQFVVFFTAVFGAVGVVLTHLTDTGSRATLGTAVAVGLLFGQGAHQILRTLRRSSGDSTPQPKDYIDKPARVTMAIAPPNKGEIVLRVGRADRHVPAISKRVDATFHVSDEVAVVGYEGGIAEVISRKEYEFLTEKD